MILNSYVERRNFQFTPNNHYRFFFFHSLPSTISFKFEHVLFYQFNAEISAFSIKKCSVRVGSFLRRLMSCTRSSYTPWYTTEISRTVKIAENLVGYARKPVLHLLGKRCPLGFPLARFYFYLFENFMKTYIHTEVYTHESKDRTVG